MKTSLLSYISLLFFVTASPGFSRNENMERKQETPHLKKGFALVELFTSEGCSSCPPADVAVAAIAREYPENIFVLGFHVDYWDYLGWKDAFSSADYSNRQKEYASVFHLESIYTPQVVVNGRAQFTGSDKTSLHTAVNREIKNDENTVIEVSAKNDGSNGIAVTCKTKPGNKSVLCVALVQQVVNSEVKKGENKGKQLHHINVVRSFKKTSDNAGSVTLHLPEGLASKDCRVIAFVQQKTDMKITGAGECGIE